MKGSACISQSLACLLAGERLFWKEGLQCAAVMRLRTLPFTLSCCHAIDRITAIQALQELPSRRGQLALQLPDGPLLLLQQLLESETMMQKQLPRS